MVKNELTELVKEIKEKDVEIEITPRELLCFFSFEKRTSGNCFWIDKFLEENQLEVFPDYATCWIDEHIMLKHKKKAKSKKDFDPIQRIRMLDSANKPPVTISRDSELKEAITLMMINSYSQLPVMSGSRTVNGVITWETIGQGLTNGCSPDNIKDFISNEITILDYDTPLLDAISTIIEKDFVLVQKSDKLISGIVTLADISTQFLNVSEPFLLLGQIEYHIRKILDGKFLVKELQEFCKNREEAKDIEHTDDLNFGEYIKIIEKPENWEKLNLLIERSIFIKYLDKIRKIRNDVMHFDTDGISDDQRKDLIKMSKFLTDLRKYPR